MLETIINTGLIITLFAIAAPFVFVLLVIKMVTGEHGHNRHRARSRKHHSRNDEDMSEVSKGLRELKRRIDNLETLKKYRTNKEL